MYYIYLQVNAKHCHVAGMCALITKNITSMTLLAYLFIIALILETFNRFFCVWAGSMADLTGTASDGKNRQAVGATRVGETC